MAYQQALQFSLGSCLNKAGCLSALLLLFCFQNSFPQYSETLYGVDAGLSHNTVIDIEEDEDGFIWVFTSFGLCRFDGFGFKEYTVDINDYKRTINYSGRILKDSKNRIWVDSALPAILISDIEHDRINIAFQMVYHDFYDIEDDGFGNFLLTSTVTIHRLKEEPDFIFSYNELKVPDNAGRINYIQRLEDGTILATGQNGFYKLIFTEDSIFAKEINLENPSKKFNLRIDDNTRFLEANNNLYLLNGQEILKTNFNLKGFSDDSIYQVEPIILDFPEVGLKPGQPLFAVIEGNGSELFIRSLNGIYSYNAKNEKAVQIRAESYGSADTSEGNFQEALYYDKKGILWAGTDKGLLKVVIGNKPFHSFLDKPDIPEALKIGKLRDLLVDSRNHLWISTMKNGLYHSVAEQDGTYKKFNNYLPDETNPYSLHDIYPGVLFEDSQHRLWVGTEEIQWMDLDNLGIFHYTKVGPLERQIAAPRNPNHIIEDPEGNILFLTYTFISSLLSADLETVNVVSLDSTRSVQWPFMQLTNNKELYLYDNCHLYKLKLPWIYNINSGSEAKDSLLKTFNESRKPIPWVYPSSIEDLYTLNTMHALVENFLITEHDAQRNIWLSAKILKKIIRIDLDKLEYEYQCGKDVSNSGFTLFPIEEDRLITYIFKILEDKGGRIWCTGNEGLLRIDPETNESLFFFKDDGLPTNKFYWGGDIRDDGTIYFSTTNGLVYFHPDSISPDPPPKLILTELKLFHKNVQADSGSILEKSISKINSLKLTHKQNFIGIGFTALDYRNTERIRFRYMLEGLDEDWINADHNRLAEYPSLSPGRYTFRVIASNGNGVWNTEGASLDVRILPPLWLRWWAIVIEAIVLVLLLIFYIRYRERELRQRAMLLEEKVDEKTREVLEQRKEVDEMKSRFYTNISHEFRTPLTLLVGPLEDSVKSREENVPMSRKILCIMLRNARRLQRLINQLLDISKIESGTMELRLIKGDLAEFVKVIGGSFLSLAESQKIKYRVQVDIKERELCFDPDKLEKVITNLLSNAFKFTPGQGQVMLSLEMQNGSMKAEELEAVLTVSDTGRGIPKDQIDHIFDRFFQVSDSDTRDVEGSGIGLALSKELVELMHGSIEVESNPGEGSKFIVKFPVSEHCFTEQELADLESGVKIREEWDEEDEEKLADVYEESLEEGSDETGEIRKEIILIVEDNPDLRNYIRDQFNSEYQIIEAQNGQTGYEKAVQHIPDLIVTDLMMPVMGGMEMCQKVKTHPLTSHIPVIMLTAKADKESKLEGLEANADDYIIKPFDAELLVVRAKNLIRQRKELRQRFEKTFLLEDNGNMDAIPFNMLKEILEVIRENLSDEDFSVNKLGDELHMSRSGVFRKIRSVAGITPIELLRMIRMKEAARLLRKNELNITQIMYQVGLKNPSHFAQTFRKFYGVNPSEYR